MGYGLVQSQAAVAPHGYWRRRWEYQKKQAAPISCLLENRQELPGQLLLKEGSPLDSLGLQHAIDMGRLKDSVWLQMETALAFRWTFSQIDIAGEKADLEVLDLFSEKLERGWVPAFRRPDDSAEELCARKEIERLKYLDREHIL
jgi:hypothetical protein